MERRCAATCGADPGCGRQLLRGRAYGAAVPPPLYVGFERQSRRATSPFNSRLGHGVTKSEEVHVPDPSTTSKAAAPMAATSRGPTPRATTPAAQSSDGPQQDRTSGRRNGRQNTPGGGREASINLVVLAGHLSGPPAITQLKSGDELRRYEVTVTPEERDGAPDRAESVPVVWFAPRRPPRLESGSPVVVLGRVRRRFFGAGGRTVSRTEVVAERVWRDSPDRRGKLLVRAVARLGSALGG